MIKLVSLSKVKEKGVYSYVANFSVGGNLTPLKVSDNDRPLVFTRINELLGKDGLSPLEVAIDLYNLMSPEANVKSVISESASLSDNMKIKNGHLYFGKYRLENSLATHMLSLLDDENKPKDDSVWKAYVKFLDNLHQNVDEDVREQLFKWIDFENRSGNAFGITSDGCLVGYKGCGGTILEPESVFSGRAIVDGVEYNGKIPNKVGSVVTMPRSEVQVDPKIGCSVGLHVGTREYAVSWAPVLTLVKVNPRDIVSVPYECNSQKMRVCEYTVLEVTDASEEHQRYIDLRDLLLGLSDEYDFEDITLEDAINIIDEEVWIVYDNHSKSFEGVVIDTYEGYDESNHGIILTNDDGDYKHIKLHRIDEWGFKGDGGFEDEDYFDGFEEDVVEDNSLEDRVRSVKVGDRVLVKYERGLKQFEGLLTDIYLDYDGLIIRDGDIVKHIKKHRITDIDVIEEVEEESNSFVEALKDIEKGAEVLIQDASSGRIEIYIGKLAIVSDNSVVIVDEDYNVIEFNPKEIISVKVL